MKRFKVHTITDKNCKWIFSKVRKFFEEHEGFTSWHQFYGGMRKRFSTYHNNYKFTFYHPFKNQEDEELPFFRVELRDQIVNDYPYEFEVRGHEDCSDIPCNVLAVTMNYDEGFSIGVGDQVAFLGNRILIRTNGGLRDYKYCYQVFQIRNKS